MKLVEKIFVRHPFGLNLRAAAQLVLITQSFHCGIVLQKGSVKADARSLLGLLTLAALPGNELEVRFDGEDAEEASTAFRRFFEEETARA